jgi:hypothetical protein
MIYLGTGFCPAGWNTGHGSFTFNPAVFPDPAAMLREMHEEHFKVMVHVTSPPEDLHGEVGDTGAALKDPSSAAVYWPKHREDSLALPASIHVADQAGVKEARLLGCLFGHRMGSRKIVDPGRAWTLRPHRLG